MTELADDVRALFEAPNFVHLATVLPDGSPHTVPIWAGLEDGRIVFFTQPTSRKARNVAREPRVALSVVDRQNPYLMASVRGRVADTIEGEPALAIIDRISRDYTGEDFPMRSGVVYVVEPDRAFTMSLPFRERT